VRAWARDHRASGGYERWGRRTDVPLIVLSLVFLGAFLVPVARPDLSAGPRRALAILNVALWLVFAIDYVVRVYLAPDRWRFVRGHVPDLVIVAVPMLRPLRAARLLRLLRLAGLAGRVTNGIRRSLHARVAVYVGMVALLAIVVAAAGMLEAERRTPESNIASFPDALWWAATTVTTVGYGDRYPVTASGRAIAIGLMVVGIALLGVVTAAVAAWFVDRLATAREEVQDAVSKETQAVLDALEDIRLRLDRIEARD
jgi:voltage-gated potassium channel